MVTDLFAEEGEPVTYDGGPVEVVGDVPRYYARTHWLPDPRQSYLLVDTIRPTFGPCPACGAPEDVYCDTRCHLVDPYNHRAVLRDLARCKRCMRTLDPGTHTRPLDVTVVPGRGHLHLYNRCPLRAHAVHRYQDRW